MKKLLSLSCLTVGLLVVHTSSATQALLTKYNGCYSGQLGGVVSEIDCEINGSKLTGVAYTVNHRSVFAFSGSVRSDGKIYGGVDGFVAANGGSGAIILVLNNGSGHTVPVFGRLVGPIRVGLAPLTIISKTIRFTGDSIEEDS